MLYTNSDWEVKTYGSRVHIALGMSINLLLRVTPKPMFLLWYLTTAVYM